MKTAKEILRDIRANFNKRIKDHFKEGSVLDIYTSAISEELEDVYEEIENNKTPHVWSYLKGERLDDMGNWLNVPRNINESDNSYKFRLYNWSIDNEKSNTSAISDALLGAQYSSNIFYTPFTRGCGTGTCYVIPLEYKQDAIEKALKEAKEIVASVASPSLYVDYVIPAIEATKFEIYISAPNADLDLIKRNIEKEIKDYVNKIPPGEYLSMGHINRIGNKQPGVDYFNTLSVIMNNQSINKLRVLQGLKTKFLFHSIVWIED